MEYRAKDSNLCGPADQEIGAGYEHWLRCNHISFERLQILLISGINENCLIPTSAYIYKQRPNLVILIKKKQRGDTYVSL